MRPQEDPIAPPHPASAYAAGHAYTQRPGYTATSVAPDSSLRGAYRSGPAFSDDEADDDPLGDWSAPGRQDAHISAILRWMSLGHLCLGLALALGGVIMEVALHQPTFFGLAASGGMLSACGLITLLAANRQRAGHSPLAFYLLPYADFAIVGLWLLLFGVTGPIILFYAYVVVSAALLLGSRHAIALAGISCATILTISLGQFQDQATPAIILPGGAETLFTIVFTTLGLGLIVYVAWLFSTNLDRFIAETNRQNSELVSARAQVAAQERALRVELETLSDTYVRFMGGEAHTRAPVSNGPLALAAHLLNTMLEQMEQLMRISATRARMEERIGELTQALERLSNGDPNALQALSSPSGTSLDAMTLGLARTGRQIIMLQQMLQRTGAGYAAVLGVASDLALLRQTLNNTNSVMHDLHTRSAQSAVHLRALLESETARIEGFHSERPFLREMELRARQQSAGLEMLQARLDHIGAQLEAAETESRRIAESIDQITKAPRLLRAGQPSATPPEHPASSAQTRPTSGPLRAADTAAALPPQYRPPSGPLHPSSGPFHSPDTAAPLPAAPLPLSGSLRPPDAAAPTPTLSRPLSGPIRASDAAPLPRRFTGPLTNSGRLNPWQTGRSEDEANSTRH